MHRFDLEPYKGPHTRHTCPRCGEKKQLTRYIDTKGEIALPSYVGRCNNQNRCRYDYPPRLYFEEHGITPDYTTNTAPLRVEPQKPVEFFTEDEMRATMKHYAKNSFVSALHLIFDPEQINRILNRYHIGTTRSHGCVFWQMDTLGRVRYGKIVQFLPDIHRDKEIPPKGIHSLMKKYNMNYLQCFFGQHLLALPENKSKTIYIIESEKGACILSEVFPDYIWLSTGGSSGIKWQEPSAWTDLHGHKVVLCPDVDAHESWVKKAETFKGFGIDVSVYEELPKVAPGTKYDLADFVISELLKARSPIVDMPDFSGEQYRPLPPERKIALSEPEPPQPTMWQAEIAELETFFSTTPISGPIRLSPAEVIKDAPRFIASHLAIVKADRESKASLPYLHRLQRVKDLCQYVA